MQAASKASRDQSNRNGNTYEAVAADDGAGRKTFAASGSLVGSASNPPNSIGVAERVVEAEEGRREAMGRQNQS